MRSFPRWDDVLAIQRTSKERHQLRRECILYDSIIINSTDRTIERGESSDEVTTKQIGPSVLSFSAGSTERECRDRALTGDHFNGFLIRQQLHSTFKDLFY